MLHYRYLKTQSYQYSIKKVLITQLHTRTQLEKIAQLYIGILKPPKFWNKNKKLKHPKFWNGGSNILFEAHYYWEKRKYICGVLVSYILNTSYAKVHA